jgi:HEAT repeat protein
MEGALPARPRCPIAWAVLSATLATAAAQPGCSPYIGTTAASFLRRVKEDPDPNVRYIAYAKLGSPNVYDTPAQKAEAVQTLISKLEKGREPVASRAAIIHSLGELRDPAARQAVLNAANDPEPVIRVQACVALGKVGKTEDATILARVMTTDMLEDCRIAAIEALGVLKPDDPRITRVLVNGMLQNDPATRLASLNALRQITGRDLGVDPEPWQKLLEDPGDTAIAGKSKSTAPAAPTATTPAPAVAAAAGKTDAGTTSILPSPIDPYSPLPPRDTRAQPAAYPPVPKPLAPYR